MGRKMLIAPKRTRPLTVIGGALALIFAAPATGYAQHGAKAVACTNNASGASWQINIDYDNSTVDTLPASIGADQISWHTTDGQFFKLDRKSGDLTVVLASSTGGFFVYDRCKLAE
jgi:hypothetical protein